MRYGTNKFSNLSDKIGCFWVVFPYRTTNMPVTKTTSMVNIWLDTKEKKVTIHHFTGGYAPD